LLAALLGLVLWTSSCRRRTSKPPEPDAAPTAPATPDESRPAAGESRPTTSGPASRPAPAALVAPGDPLQDRALAEDLRFLNEQLREFVAQQKRFPRSYQEFEGIKIDSPRRPPAGMKWSLDPQARTVVLVPR